LASGKAQSPHIAVFYFLYLSTVIVVNPAGNLLLNDDCALYGIVGDLGIRLFDDLSQQFTLSLCAGVPAGRRVDPLQATRP
jgi:hypothetical protein